METFSERQEEVIAAANKQVLWMFRIQDTLGNWFYRSTGYNALVPGGLEEVGAIEAPGVWLDGEQDMEVPFGITNFAGVTLRRSKSESGIHAPNDISFTLMNKGNTLTAANYIGGTVRVSLIIADATGREVCGSWRFRIRTASPYNQQIDMTCEDFLQEYLVGSYPNTRLISDIFPAAEGTAKDNVCVPESYGTAYIPLRSVYAGAARHYLLGRPVDSNGDPVTYTIDEVRSPRELGPKIVWTSAGFTFQQATNNDAGGVSWRMFQPLIADGDSGLFLNGSKILDVPTKFSRSDTASLTNPADIIRRVLNNMGVDDYDLNLTSFDAAAATFTGWGLTWNFAFWYKQDRARVLSTLLAMCHSALVLSENVSLVALSKTSQMTLTTAQVLKSQEVGPDTFKYADSLGKRQSDSGYVTYQQAGESQDEFIKIIVPAKATTAQIDNETIDFPGVQNTVHVQKLGTLYYQRKFLKEAEVSNMLKGLCLALRPDDVVTIDNADYGGTYDVLVEEVSINPDASLSITAIRFAEALDDWADLSPGAITIASSAPTGAFAPVISGPDTTPTSGSPPNALLNRLRLGTGTDYLVMDPASPMRLSMYVSDVEKFRIGNLNGFLGYASDLYGIAIGDATEYLKYEATNGLRISGKFEAGTIDIGGADASSFHVDASGNIWAGAATFDIGTNPFAVSAAGVLRAMSGAIGGFTLDSTEGLYAGADATRVQMKPGAGFWAGATAFDAAPFRVSQAGALVASSATITGTINATAGYMLTLTLGKSGVSSGTLTLELNDGGGDTYIAAGKTDYDNTVAGFILGLDDSDSDKPKFYIGDATKYLNWDGAALTIAGATLSSIVIAGTTADAFTINSDATDANADLVLGRTTGGNATLRWNGTIVAIDKNFQCPTINLTGGQIAFPSAQSASADPNTLDDYQEGTWTPDVGGTATYGGENYGLYVKIGKWVYLTGALNIDAIGTGSATTISGLPFAVSRTQAANVSYFGSLAVNTISLHCLAYGSTLLFYGLSAAAATVTQLSLIGSGTLIYFSAVYETSG